jgi:hypothetical protein
MIRGLGAGQGGGGDDDVIDPEEAGPTVKRKKFPTGKIKVCIEGEVKPVMNNITFKELYRREGKRIGDYVWTQRRTLVNAYDKLRYHFSPEVKGVAFIDPWLENDPLTLPKGTLGNVKLKIGKPSFETPNNETFAAAVIDNKTEPTAAIIRIPSLGISIEILRVRVRQLVPASRKREVYLE